MVGLRRAGIATGVRDEIKRAYRLLYREGLNVPNAIEAIARECQSPQAKLLVEFITHSKRGICAGMSTEEAESEESILPRKPAQFTPPLRAGFTTR